MKKHIIGIFTIFVCLFLFGMVSADPADVHLIPLNKWNYKNVDGWGFYAKNGDYSWLGFILHNPTDSSYTVSLPYDADIAHATRHKIVNTSYKVMINGSVDFLYAGFTQKYFTGRFTLPKNSTYAVFMDIADIQAYSGQWDTDVFFPVQISGNNKTSVINIHGILAYDAKNTTPEKLVLTNKGTPALSKISFNRKYTNKTKTVRFTYVLKNNTAGTIPVKLGTKLKVQGLKKKAKISYTKCKSGGSSCKSRISGGTISLKAGETVSITGKARLSAKPAKTNFYIKTTLLYRVDNQKQTSKTIKTASKKSTAAVPSPVTVIKSGSPADNGPLTAVSFCRDYSDSGRKVSFAYTLKNSTSVTIPVELASTLAVQGQNNTSAIRYTDCISGGSSCRSRISSSGYSYFDMKSGETAVFYGESTLSEEPASADFFIRTSLRYDYNGMKQIPLPVGSASDTCSVPHALDPENTGMDLLSGEEDPVSISVHLINDKDTDLPIIPDMIQFDDRTISSYLGKAVVYALDNEISGGSEISFLNGQPFIMPPYSQADIEIRFNIDTPIYDLEKGSVNWNYTADTEQTGD